MKMFRKVGVVMAAAMLALGVMPAGTANATHTCNRYSHHSSTPHQYTLDGYLFRYHTAGYHDYLTGAYCAYNHRDQAHYH